MGMAVPILGGVGAGISAIGAISGGAAQAAEANYQSQVAANNAIVAQHNAQYATQAGETQTYNVGQQERAKAAHITSGLGASGLDVDTGSSANVRKSQAALGEQNEEQTASNAALTAYGYRTQQTSFEAESELQKAAAPKDAYAGVLSGLATLASGVSNVGWKWAGLSNNPTYATP